MISYRRLRHSFGAFLALSVGVLLTTATVQAGTIDANHVPTIKMQVQGAPDTWDYSPSATAYVPAKDGSAGYELNTPQDAYGVCDNHANVRVEQLKFNA